MEAAKVTTLIGGCGDGYQHDSDAPLVKYIGKETVDYYERQDDGTAIITPNAKARWDAEVEPLMGK